MDAFYILRLSRICYLIETFYRLSLKFQSCVVEKMDGREKKIAWARAHKLL